MQRLDGTNTAQLTTTDILSLPGGPVSQSETLPRKLAGYSSGEASYYQLDALGSGRAVTDGSGAVAGGFASFGDFGTRLSPAPTPLAPSFTGYEHDAYTGLEYAKNRYYDPATASFISSDPYPVDHSDLLGANLYNYVQGNPVNSTDPLGWYWIYGTQAIVPESHESPSTIAYLWGTSVQRLQQLNNPAAFRKGATPYAPIEFSYYYFSSPTKLLWMPVCNRAFCQIDLEHWQAEKKGIGHGNYGDKDYPNCDITPWECETFDSKWYDGGLKWRKSLSGWERLNYIPTYYIRLENWAGSVSFQDDNHTARRITTYERMEAQERYDAMIAGIELTLLFVGIPPFFKTLTRLAHLSGGISYATRLALNSAYKAFSTSILPGLELAYNMYDSAGNMHTLWSYLSNEEKAGTEFFIAKNSNQIGKTLQLEYEECMRYVTNEFDAVDCYLLSIRRMYENYKISMYPITLRVNVDSSGDTIEVCNQYLGSNCQLLSKGDFSIIHRIHHKYYDGNGWNQSIPPLYSIAKNIE